MTRIAGSTILITGAASGIGRLLALRMGRLGGNLVLWDIDEEKLERVLGELMRVSAAPPRGYRCDVSEPDEVERVAARVKTEVGRVDVLVNNAGVVIGKPLVDAAPADVERCFRVNSHALFWTTRAFLPAMVEANRGHVVTIASAAGLVGVARLSAYCASKWAAVGFDESLRMELRRTAPGIHTTVVCPFFVDTGMFAGVRSRFPFLLPILRPDYVADHIVRAIRRNHAKLVMPRFVHTVPLLRLMPIKVFDRVADVLGINRAMDHFVGRPPVAEGP